MKFMNFKIDSYSINEHRNELVLYVGDAIFCTICCRDNSIPITEEEIDNIISDIEWEQNKDRSKNWIEYLSK